MFVVKSAVAFKPLWLTEKDLLDGKARFSSCIHERMVFDTYTDALMAITEYPSTKIAVLAPSRTY